MFFKKDHLGLGIVLGFFAPLLGLIAFYFIKFKSLTFLEFLQLLSIYQTLLTSVISLSLITNAVIFTLYINQQKDKTARGLFIATCIYAIILLSIKLFGVVF